jgi:hypothetical protein
MKNASEINISNITNEQIGACHKVLHRAGNFYLVENSQGTLDDAGLLIEYKVTWTPAKGFQCTCKAAEAGRMCWHIRASVACEAEVRGAMQELEKSSCVPQTPAREHVLTINGQLASDEEYNRIMNAQPKSTRRGAIPASNAFSLMR